MTFIAFCLLTFIFMFFKAPLRIDCTSKTTERINSTEAMSLGYRAELYARLNARSPFELNDCDEININTDKKRNMIDTAKSFKLRLLRITQSRPEGSPADRTFLVSALISFYFFITAGTNTSRVFASVSTICLYSCGPLKDAIIPTAVNFLYSSLSVAVFRASASFCTI